MKTQNLFRVLPVWSCQLFFSVLFCIPPVCTPLRAQTIVSRSCNAMRAGDCLVKQQVEYKDPGRKGEHVLWDFSKQQLLDENYRVNYSGMADSLVTGEEHRALYSYLLQGDSLLLGGIQNRTMLVDNRKPELLLVYPTAYGDRHEDYFHGNGDYGDRLFITARGKVSVEADAWGMLLLPQGDTLQHVLRVRHLKTLSEQMVPYAFIQPGDTVYAPDSINMRLASDTLLLQVETYRWYAAGWRYPVFETVSNRFILHGKPKEYSRSSFYYKPVDQYYDLSHDPANQAVRDEEQACMEAARTRKGAGDSGNDASSPETVNYNVSLADGNNTLNLEYSLSADAQVSIMLFDMQARQLSALHKGRQAAGFYRESVSLNGLQPGEYTLRLVVDGQLFGLKIIK